MNSRRILIIAALGLFALIAWRIVGIFMPHLWVRWLWWLLLSPYLLVGGLLVIALLILAILLIGQIRYSIKASIHDKQTAHVNVTYLFRLVRCTLIYKDGEQRSRISIAGMQLGGKPSKKKQKKRNAKTTAPKNESQPKTDVATHAEDFVRGAEKKDYAKKVTSLINIANNAGDADSIVKEKIPAPPVPAITIMETRPPEPEKADEKEEKEKKDRLKPLKQAKAVLTYPDRKIIMSLCGRFLQKLLRALKPRHLDIHGVIGFDDPCTTGWAMGSYEAIVGVTGLKPHIRILGSYFEKALRLDINTHGRTRLGSIIWPFLWLALQKPVRKLIRKQIFS